MKIILEKDVAHLGQKGDVKEVKPGYARNFLFVQGFAKRATPDAIKEGERLKKQREAETVLKESAFGQTLKKLSDVTLTFSAKTNEQGGLFRQITKKQIIVELKKIGFEAINEDDIHITEPIKQAGEHKVKISKGELAGELKIVVEAKK